MYAILDFPVGTAAKKLPANEGDTKFDPWVRKISWKRKWQSTPVFLPKKIPWTEETVGYKGYKQFDTTEQLNMHA